MQTWSYKLKILKDIGDVQKNSVYALREPMDPVFRPLWKPVMLLCHFNVLLKCNSLRRIP